MFNPFAHAEQNLGRAGWLLALELAGLATAGLALHSFGLADDYLFVAAWLFNLFPAWFLSRAARALGRHAPLCGLISAMAPAGAIAVWIWLYQQDYWRISARRAGRSGDET